MCQIPYPSTSLSLGRPLHDLATVTTGLQWLVISCCVLTFNRRCLCTTRQRACLQRWLCVTITSLMSSSVVLRISHSDVNSSVRFLCCILYSAALKVPVISLCAFADGLQKEFNELLTLFSESLLRYFECSVALYQGCRYRVTLESGIRSSILTGTRVSDTSGSQELYINIRITVNRQMSTSVCGILYGTRKCESYTKMYFLLN